AVKTLRATSIAESPGSTSRITGLRPRLTSAMRAVRKSRYPVNPSALAILTTVAVETPADSARSPMGAREQPAGSPSMVRATDASASVRLGSRLLNAAKVAVGEEFPLLVWGLTPSPPIGPKTRRTDGARRGRRALAA